MEYLALVILILILVCFFKSLWTYSAIEQTQMRDHLDRINLAHLAYHDPPLTLPSISAPKTPPFGRSNLRLIVSSTIMTRELNQVTCSSKNGPNDH